MRYWVKYKKWKSTAERNKIRKLPKRLKNLKTYADGNAYHRCTRKIIDFEEEQLMYETFCCTA